MNRRRLTTVVLLLVTAAFIPGCEKEQRNVSLGGKLLAVTTLFPLYDFTRNIAGARADVNLLLPPGAEPHSYEPTPRDLMTIEKASLFIYTGRHMEPWAEALLKGVRNTRLGVVDASTGIPLRRAGSKDDHHGHAHGQEEARSDPHIWLDFSNAVRMVETITDALAAKDPEGATLYRANGRRYADRLLELDKRYRETLSRCRARVFLHGGHFAFNYLAERYGLRYLSAYRDSPDAEPSPRDIAEMTTVLRQHRLKHLFYEELMSPGIARALAREAGVDLLRLHGAHNVTREEMAAGVSFISLMEQNLSNLETGLQCR